MEWYIDFSGYCIIEAENEDEARHKFWDCIMDGDPLPINYYEIQSVEEKED